MDVNVIVLIGLIASVCSIVFGYLGFVRGKEKERSDKEKECKSEGKESGELKADTVYIRRRIDDILLEQRDTNKTLNVHSDRLARVEESAKSAHHRIDEIKNGGIT
jgi:hypothetical protein